MGLWLYCGRGAVSYHVGETYRLYVDYLSTGIGAGLQTRPLHDFDVVCESLYVPPPASPFVIPSRLNMNSYNVTSISRPCLYQSLNREHKTLASKLCGISMTIGRTVELTYMTCTPKLHHVLLLSEYVHCV
jgi:hypothetical protein